MIVAMQGGASEEQICRVIERLIDLGFEVHRSTGSRHTVLGAVGAGSTFCIRDLEALPGVSEVHRLSSPYKLVSCGFRPEGTIVKFANGVTIGGDEVVVMAGPCSIESREQILSVAEAVYTAGARFLCGGAFNLCSSPYSFQGMGEEGLQLMREAACRFGLLVVSEVMEISQIQLMMPYIDMFQVGARNMQNFNLLRELSKVREPVLLKRSSAATMEDLLLSAEYLMAGGNYEVVLCERGIRTFETCTYNTMDISAIPVVKHLSHLPIVADPSHGTGRRDRVSPMAKAAVAAGADGLVIEVHNRPDQATCDGAHSLYPEQFASLMNELRIISSAVGRKVNCFENSFPIARMVTGASAAGGL